MVIDTSAVVAIFEDEAERAAFLRILISDRRCLISSGALLETQIVLSRSPGVETLAELDLFLERFNIQVVPFDRRQADFAKDAFLRFGKGRHPAGLNFGDCMTYALAKQTGEPLLFKGNDFSKTDILMA